MRQRILLTLLAIVTFTTSTMAQSPYGLTVAGVKVNDGNKDNLIAALTAAGVTASGTMAFNSGTNTLTMNAVNIEYSYMGIFLNDESRNLTIDVTGECKITTPGNPAIENDNGTVKITGSGSLECSGSFSCFAGAPLTIENTTFIAKNSMRGSGASLTIKNSTVKAKNITNWTSITLTDCYISQPSGAVVVFDAVLGTASIQVDGSNAEDIVILPSTTGITTVRAATAYRNSVKLTLPYWRWSTKRAWSAKVWSLPCSKTKMPSGFRSWCSKIRSGICGSSFSA